MILLRDLEASGRRPRFHGNGFVQLPVGEARRLHVWHPSMPPIEGHNATIHNHVWDMQSRVLLGSLTHRTWVVERCQYMLPDATHDLYVARHNPETEDLAKFHDGWASARISGEYQMAAGSIYVFAQGQFHESESHCLTATIMEKRDTGAHRIHGPLVVSPVGQTPTDAFAVEHQPSETDMWGAIWDAIDHMHPSMRHQLEASIA